MRHLFFSFSVSSSATIVCRAETIKSLFENIRHIRYAQIYSGM